MTRRVTLQETLINISADRQRYARWRHAGFWVTFCYRLRRLRKFGGPLWKLMLPLDIALELSRLLISDTKIPSNMDVGPGLYLPHPTGVVINDSAVIGAEVDLFQQVTLGEWHGNAPILEDGCKLFAGARAFGDVRIGFGAKIGANTVIQRDVPANYVAYLDATKVRPKIERAADKIAS